MSAVAERGKSPGAAVAPGLPVLRRGGAAYWLSGLLAVTAVAVSLLTFLVPGLLHGTAVMNGSARGTALAVLLLGVPVLTVSMAMARAGSARAVLCWLGAAGFVLYNSVLFLFATPVNRLFLLDVAMLALAAWSVGTLLWQTEVARLGGRFADRAPVRGVALYAWVIVALNALAWLSRIVPALGSGGQAAFLRGTGLPTNPVYVQDLALWLPLIAVAAGWLWRRRAWGFLVIGGALVMWVLESASIAVDQWYGHAADPASSVASAALAPAFAVLAVIGMVPAYYLFRSLRSSQEYLAGGRIPVADHRSWPAWLLAGMLMLVGAAGVFGGISLARNGFGMPLSWLHHTPFTGWALPGVALLIGVALPQFIAFGLIVSGHRWALAGSYLAGLGLVLWIAVQALLLQRYFVMQPAIAAAGAVEMLLAWLWQRATAASARPVIGRGWAVTIEDMAARSHFTPDEARSAGERIGVDWDSVPYDLEQFRMGMDVELEHGMRDPQTNVTGDDVIMTAKIARAHLNEFPDYYTRLAKMEAEAEAGGTGGGE